MYKQVKSNATFSLASLVQDSSSVRKYLGAHLGQRVVSGLGAAHA